MPYKISWLDGLSFRTTYCKDREDAEDLKESLLGMRRDYTIIEVNDIPEGWING